MWKLLFTASLAALLVACASTPLPPQAAVATPPSQQPAAGDATQPASIVAGAERSTQTSDQNKRICRQEQPLGSHIPQRICISREQMEARHKADQEAYRNMTEKGHPCPSTGPGC